MALREWIASNTRVGTEAVLLDAGFDYGFAKWAASLQTALEQAIKPVPKEVPQKLDIWPVRNAIIGNSDARPAIVLDVDMEKKEAKIIPSSAQTDVFDPSRHFKLTPEENKRMNLYLDKPFSFLVDEPKWVPFSQFGRQRISHVPVDLVGKLAGWLGFEPRHMVPPAPRPARQYKPRPKPIYTQLPSKVIVPAPEAQPVPATA